MALPLNPGANPAAPLPPGVLMLPQAARVNLLGQLTNCYVLLTGEGGWVVDPPTDEAAALAEIVAAAGGKIAGILLTHSHPDHTGGVAALQALTGAPVRAHPRARPHLAAGLLVEPLREGERVGGWQVYEVPGHRFDSLLFFQPDNGCAVVGDLVAGAGTVVLDPSDGDLGDYLHSLRRLRDELRPRLLLPGHGPVIDDAARLLGHFIEHRLAREARVLAALGDEPATLDDLLPRAYAGTDPALFPLARRSLLAHLIKLQQEGRAVGAGVGWKRGEW